MKHKTLIANRFDHNYYFDNKAILPLSVKWRFKTASVYRPLGQPLILENRIWLYAPLEKGGNPFGPSMIYEIDLVSGEKISELRMEMTGGWVSRNCIFNQLFITSTKDEILGIRNGKVLFTSRALSNRTKSLVCDDHYLYCSGEKGIAKVNKNGDAVNVFSIKRPSALSLSNDKLVFGSGTNLFCLSADTLEAIWTTDLSEIGKYYELTKSRMHRRDIFALGKLSGRYAVISKNKIFCDVGNNIICLSFETGEVLWKAEAVGDSVHIDQRLVTYSTVGNFFCLNAETGEIFFKNTPTEIHGLNVSKPYVSGHIFFVGTNKIIAIDINNGNLLWDFQSDEEETYFFDPVYVDGNLFVGCSDGYLYCFNSQPE